MWVRLALGSGRFKEIGTVLARYGLADWIGRLDHDGLIRKTYRWIMDPSLSELSHGERWCRALTELGPVFIKLGQYLAGRPDLIGRDLSRDLGRLRESVEAVPSEVIRERIASELGRPVDAVFARFDDEPLGTASIAQVHAARLIDGREVVVKVRRPDLMQRAKRDLDLLRVTAEVAETHLTELAWLRPTRLARGFAGQLLGELDLRNEAAHLTEFHQRFVGDRRVRIPQVVDEFTTERILVMDRITGRSLEELAGASREERRQVARNGAGVLLDMVFRDGAFHDDPHPGNLRALEDGVVGLLDFGTVGRLARPMREELGAMLHALVEQDGDHLVRTLERLGSLEHCEQRELLAADLSDLLVEFAADPERLQLREALDGLQTTLRRHRVALPHVLARLIRVLALLDVSVTLLRPGFGFAALMIPYQRRMLLRDLRPDRQVRRWWRSARRMSAILERLPGDLADVLISLRRGRIDVRIHHEDLAGLINRLALALISAALIIAGAMLLAMKLWPTIGDISIIGLIVMGLGLACSWLLFSAIRRTGGLR